jgi:hypothetical protein
MRHARPQPHILSRRQSLNGWDVERGSSAAPDWAEAHAGQPAATLSARQIPILAAYDMRLPEESPPQTPLSRKKVASVLRSTGGYFIL